MFTDAGKRRLRLRVGETERLLKVPRDLRRHLIGKFRPGETIRVSGSEERDAVFGTSKWGVAAVLPVGGEAVAPVAVAVPGGPIRVCARKNCWKNGGRELFAALERGLEERGLAGRVPVKAVSCLDRCKQGPNIDWGDREFARCTLRDAAALLDLAATTAVPA